MPVIIPRAMPFIDLLNQTTNAAQIERMQAEASRQRERDRQQRLAITAGVTAATLGTAAVAAPALGLAGTAATQGFAAGGTWVPGMAATTGLLGAGGSLGLAGGLAAAGLGMQMGGAIADQNYVGAGQAALGAGARLAQAQQDQALYGYSPTNEEKAIYAHAAAQSGTNMGAVRQMAQQRGITIPQALQQSQQSYQIQQHDLELEYAAKNQHALFQQGVKDMYGGGKWESQPDQQAIDSLWEDQQKIMSSVQRFEESGGTDGRPMSEYADRWSQINNEMEIAKQGRPRPAGPRMTIHGVDGKPLTLRPGEVDVANGLAAVMKPDGSMDLRTFNPSQRTQQPPPYTTLPPGSPERKAAEQDYINSYILTDNNGNQYRRNENNTLEPVDHKATPSQQFTTSSIESLFKPDSTGAIPAIENPESVGRAIITGDRIEQAPKLDRAVHALASDPASINKDSLGELGRAAMYIYGEEWGKSAPGQAIIQMNQLLKQQADQLPGPIPPQGPSQPPQPPPPGSAAAAETIRNEANMAVQKFAPEAQQQRANERSATARTEATVKEQQRQKKLVESIGGKENATPYEKAAIANIGAGIDEPVTVLRITRGNLRNGVMGRTEQQSIPKGSLTPELIAKLKSEGWTIPGLE